MKPIFTSLCFLVVIVAPIVGTQASWYGNWFPDKESLNSEDSLEDLDPDRPGFFYNTKHQFDQSEYKPDQSEYEPAQSEDQPDQLDDQLDESEYQPDQSEYQPDQSEYQPNQSEYQPDNSETPDTFDENRERRSSFLGDFLQDLLLKFPSDMRMLLHNPIEETLAKIVMTLVNTASFEEDAEVKHRVDLTRAVSKAKDLIGFFDTVLSSTPPDEVSALLDKVVKAIEKRAGDLDQMDDQTVVSEVERDNEEVEMFMFGATEMFHRKFLEVGEDQVRFIGERPALESDIDE